MLVMLGAESTASVVAGMACPAAAPAALRVCDVGKTGRRTGIAVEAGSMSSYEKL
jgi:hypothetical protein